MIRIFTIMFLFPLVTFAQSEKMHIGNEESNPSAILQVDKISQGVLVPRMSSLQKNEIIAPAEGLLIYDNDTHSFWFYDGIEWDELYHAFSNEINFIQSTQGNVVVQVEEGNTDDDLIICDIGNREIELGEETFKLKEDLSIEIKDLTVPFDEVSIDEHNSLRVGTYENGIGERGENSLSISKGIKVESINGFAVGFGAAESDPIVGKNAAIFGNSNASSGENNFVVGSSNEVTGNQNTILGFNNNSIGNSTVILGYSNEALAANATAIGDGSKATGLISTALGKGLANGIGSMAWGFGEADGNYSFCWGDSTKAYTNDEIALGHHVTSYTPTGTSSDRLFVIGTGDPKPPYNQPYFDVFRILKDNSVIHKGEVELMVEESESVILGLKEETNGTHFGFEFEYEESSQNLQLRSRNFSGNDAVRMIVDQDGKVGIGLQPTTNRLEINGNASKTTSGPWAGNSDRRLKKNIQNMDSHFILEKVLKMQGVSYQWNDDKTNIERPKAIQYGFIAQDLDDIWPQKVSEDGLGYLQTAYGDFDPFFVGAFKAHQKKIIELQGQNKFLDKNIKDLNAKNEVLLTEIKDMEVLINAVKEKLNKE